MSFGQSKETVCKYYLQGQCRFGTNCRFAHPAGQGPASSSNAGSFKNQTWTAKDARQPSFDAESLRKDFAQGVDRPLYPLSSFGPGKCIPCVIDGLDQSPEELRVAAWTAVREGVGLDSYKAHEKQLIDTAQALINTAASTGAAVTLDESKRIWNAVDERGIPSANGAAEAKSRLRERLQPSTSGPAFGSTPNAPAFGTTSAFGASQPAQPSAFGGTSFVKPGTGAFGTSTAASTFGSTSAFGASPQPSAFGAPAQPSAFGSTPTTSAFGQSGFGAKPAFGQSGFGTTAAPTTSAFGSSSTTAATPAFGQSAFGSSTTTAPAFGQSAFGAKPTTSAFGASGTGGGFGAFSGKSSSFGGTGGTTNATPAFGAPASTSAFGSGTGGTSAFGASSGTGSAFGAFATKSTSFGGQPTSAFGSTPAAAGGAFGQPAAATAMDAGMESDTPAQPPAFAQPAVTSAFGQTQPTPSAFGQSQPATTSAFGQTSAFGSGGSAFGASKPSAFGSSAPTTSAFGAAPTASAFGGSAFGAPAKPSAFGQPAATSNPFGAKTSAKDRDPYATLLPPDYETTLSEAIMNAFRADRFELGSIPECVPPLGLR